MDTIHYMLDNAGYLASLTFQHLWLVAPSVWRLSSAYR